MSLEINNLKQAYDDKKYIFIPNAINLKTFNIEFDFNSLFALQATRNFQVLQKGNDVYQTRELEKEFIFHPYIQYIKNNFKKIFNFHVGPLDFFYSTMGGKGVPHQDQEHVVILGIKNTTYYHIKNEDITLCPGDLLYIYKGMWHHVFSSRERIVLSLSLFEV